MRHRLALILSTAALALVLIPVAARPARGKVVGPPDVAWKDMTFKQKRAYMKTAVMPVMKPIFQAFDAKKFDNFKCETCHGPNAADEKYKMPSKTADIKALPNTPEAFEAKMKVEPTWPKFTEFMAKKVEPAMGKLLDVPVFDPKKPVEGAFGCVKCHTLTASK